ncbi:MAG TPA: hypothetical protein VJS66_08145 [Burkholderiales bacterium]|nr:hypothetical protein [Burkholderiales bacterium]
MYFWRIDELKKLIVKRGLSETQVFYYVLIYVVFAALGTEMAAYFPTTDPGVWEYVQSVMNCLIPIVGTVAAYRANGGAAGTAFVEKYFSIGFVMLVRFLVYLLPILVVLVVYYAFSLDWSSLDDDDAEAAFASSWFEVTLFSLWLAAMYWRICQHIKDTVALLKPSDTHDRSPSPAGRGSG